MALDRAKVVDMDDIRNLVLELREKGIIQSTEDVVKLIIKYYGSIDKLPKSAVNTCNLISMYLEKTKDQYPVEVLDESDIANLGVYEKCYVISIYELLCRHNNIELASWCNHYRSIKCKRDEVHLYIELKKNPFAPEKADEIFEMYMNKSIEPFRSHGLPVTEFYYTA